jgi:hypothetical protein
LKTPSGAFCVAAWLKGASTGNPVLACFDPQWPNLILGVA